MRLREMFRRVLTGFVLGAAVFLAASCDTGLGAAVDVTAPKVSITTPSASGGYYQGTFTLKGTATDDIGVASIIVSYTGADGAPATKAATLAGTDWSVDLTSGQGGDLPEGKNSITVKVTDASEKSASDTTLAYIDNLSPTVMVTYPLSHGPNDSLLPRFTDTIDIKGEVADASPISKVTVTLIDATGATVSGASKVADGTNTWSVRFALKGALALSDGTRYFYTVEALDLAGNVNTWYYSSSDIYPLLPSNTAFPTINEINALDIVGKGDSASGIAFTGLKSKRMGPSSARYGDFKYVAAAVPSVNFSNLDATKPANQNTLGPGSVLTGNIIPPVNTGAMDLNSLEVKIYNTTALTVSSVPLVTIKDTDSASDADNIKLVSLGDSLGFTIILRDGSNGSGGLQLGPGPYIVTITAKSSGSQLSTQQAGFFIDSEAPTLTETSIGNGTQYKNAPFTFGGNAISSLGLDRITFSQSKDGGAAITSIAPVTFSGAGSGTWTSPSLPTSTADGSYDYEIKLTGTSGKTTSLFRTVVYDGTSPTISLNQVTPAFFGSNVVSASSLDVVFGPSDASGISEVEWWLIPGTSTTPPTWGTGFTGNTLSAPYSTSLDFGSLAEGPYMLWFAARDKAGNISNLTLPTSRQSIFFDKLAPTLSVGSVTTPASAAFNLTGTIYDTNPKSLVGATPTYPTLSYSWTKTDLSNAKTSGSGTISFSASGTPNSAPGNTWSLPVAVNTGTHADDGTYSYSFVATDAAGRVNSNSTTVGFIIDTSPPHVTVSSPTANQWKSTTSLSPTGSVTDASGIASVYILADDATVDHSTDSLPGSWALANVAGSNWTVPTPITLVGEGTKTLWVKAIDTLGNVTTTSEALAAKVAFGLDSSPPALTFTDSVATLVNGAFTLAGTATDTNPANTLPGTPSIEVSSGAASTPLTITSSGASPVGGTWSYSPTLPADGSHTYVFSVTDIAGKSTTLSRTIGVDTQAPTSVISSPANLSNSNPAYWLSGATATLSGTSSDVGLAGVATLYYQIVTKGSPTVGSPSTWSQATGNTNWNITHALATEGEFTLWVAAKDNAGNIQTPISRDFGVDQSAPSATEVHAATSSSKVAFTLSGNLSDTNALANLKITEAKSPGGPTVIVNQAFSGTSQSWSKISLPSTGLVDGSYTYVITTTDVAGKTFTINRTVTVDTTAPNVTLTAIPSWISSAAWTISGSGSDPNVGASGVSVIEYQLDGGSWTNASWTDTSGGGNTTGTWNANLSGLAEGSHALVVRATDAASNTTTLSSVNFGVDLSAPSLGVSATPSTINDAGAASFTQFSGTLTDTNPLGAPGVTVSWTKNGTTQTPPTITVASGTWTWPFTVDTVGHTTDGIYAFTFVGTDVSGKTSTITRNITIDTLAPQITVTTPVASSWSTSTTLFASGIASDGMGTGTTAVYVLIDAQYVAATGTDHSADDPVAAGWTLATGQFSWNWTTTLAGEGRKTLWIKAVDTLGNMTTTAEAVTPNPRTDFGLDLSPPSLSFTDSVPTLAAAGVTYLGTATDTNPAGVPTATVAIDGGSATAVTVGAGTWSSAYAVNAATHAQDGNHSFVFTVTDIAGRTTSLSRSLKIDTQAPTAVITSPANLANSNPSYWLSGSTATFSGTSSDAGLAGVASVYYKVGGLYVAATSTDHSAEDPTTWTLATGNSNWNVTYPLSTEGEFTLWTAAVDNAGNPQVAVRRNFGADQSGPSVTEIHSAVSSSKIAFSLSGNLTDTNALSNLSITEAKDAGSASSIVNQSFSGTSQSWSKTGLPTTGVVDGSYAYVITTTDVAGKTSTINRTVTIDTTAPNVTLTAVPSWISSAAWAFSGTGSDPNAGASGVSTIQYQLDGGSWTNATWVDTSGGANTAGTWSTTLTGLAEGNHALVVRATDAASNTTTLGSTNFGVDLNAPTFGVGASPATINEVGAGSFTQFSGTVTDSNPSGAPGVTISWTKNGATQTPPTISVSSGTWTWPFTIDAAGHSTDGIYAITFTATDVSGKSSTVTRNLTVDTNAPAVTVTSPGAFSWITNATPTATGTANDGTGSGTTTVYVLADNVYVATTATDHSLDDPTNDSLPSAHAHWTPVTTAFSWSTAVSLTGEGHKSLWVKAVDALGNVSSASDSLASKVNFDLDLNVPNVFETTVNTASTVIRNSAVTFAGTANDTNALAVVDSLTVSIDGGSTTTIPVSSGSWTWNYSVNTSTHAQDGTHAFLFTVTDIVGRSSTLSRSVKIDTTEATPSVTNLSTGTWVSTPTQTVRGSADDGSGSGVSQVWTLVDLQGVDHSADSISTITTGGAWKLATGTVSWNYLWSLGAEGTKTVWVQTLDNAGNWNASAASVNFGFDQTAPVLAINSLTAYNVPFSFTGTTSDGTGSGVASLQYKIDSGSYSAVTVAASWSAPTGAPAFTALTEGPHTVTVQSTDTAGNVTTQFGSFNKDTTAPTVSYSTIGVGGTTVVQDSIPIIRGTLQDASGLASSSTFTVASYNYSLNAWTNIPALTNTNLGVTGTPTSFNFSVDMSSYPDGRYRISLVVPDIVPGTPNTLSTSPVTFYMSQASPSVTISTPNMGTFQSGNFSVTGTAGDYNAVTSVVAKVGSGSIDFTTGTSTAYAAADITSLDLTADMFTTYQNHGLASGDIVYFTGSLLPSTASGTILTSTPYYVISANLTATTFSVSTSNGGAKTDFTSNGSQMLVGGPSMKYTPVQSVTVGGTILTAANHGLAVGNVVYFQGASVSPADAYYVISANFSTSAFSVSTTSGGSAVSITGSSVTFTASNKAVKWLVPSLPISGWVDGPLTAFVKVNAGNTAKASQTSRDFTLDTTPPTMALTSPSSGSRSVGNLTLIGTSTDPGSVPAGVTGTIQYQVGRNYNLGNAGSWTSANVSGGSYSWSINLGDMSGFANASYSIESDSAGNPQSGTNLWKLPIVFQSVDKAGNVGQLTTYYLILDPNGNVPVVTVTQPNSGITVGGQVRISGTASQPVWVHSIEVSEDPTNTGTFTTWQPATLITTGNSVIWYYDINKTNAYPQSGSNQTVQVQIRAWNSPTANGAKGTISGSLTTPFSLNFNSTFPKIQSVQINGASYYSQLTTHGEVNVTASISSSKGISKIEAVESSPLGGALPIYDSSSNTFSATTNASNGSYWSSTVTASAPVNAGTFPFGGNYRLLITSLGDTDWSAIGGPASPTIGASFAPTGAGSGTGQAVASDSTGNFVYSVNMTIHSTALYNNTSGVYSFDFRATDWGSPAQVSNSNITLNEDNFSPTTTLSTPASVTATTLTSGKRYMVATLGTTDFTLVGARVNSVGQTFVALGAGSGTGTAIEVLTGSSLKIQGSATDVGSGSGSIGGLSKVIVYLTRGSTVLDIKTGGAPDAGTTQTVNDFANGGALGSVLYPVTTAYSNFFASIDNNTEIGFTDVNGDGLLESLLSNGNAKDWWAQIDTTLLTDGPVTVHEVIWDNAGNASHYSQSAFVANKAPVMTSIELGTDLNGDGNVSAGEITTYPAGSAFSATGFTVRNSRFYLKPNYSNGANTPVYFSVKYGATERNASLVASSLIITDFSTIADSSAANDRTFTLQVYDTTEGTTPGTDSQGFVQTVSVSVKNFDTVAPTVQLAPFGQRWSVPIDSANGNVKTDTGKVLGAVAAYTDNVVGSIGALQGHVEYPTDSRYNPLSVTLATPATGSFTNTGTNGLITNSQVYLAWTVAPSSTPAGAGPYYVIGTPTSTSFQLSTTPGGVAAVFGSAGTGLTLATADLSGKVIFRGKIVDDQKISSLTVTIPGFNTGNPFTLATWSSAANAGAGGLVASTGTDWTFAVDSGTESVSQADGHVANWALTFDTSKIATVTAANLPVTFTATDGGGNTSVTSMNVDIVPYITDFGRQAPLTNRLSNNNMNPGATGYYPVAQNVAGYVITGFNLYYSTANVTIGSTSLTIASPTTTSLSATIPSSLLPVVGTASANLTVTTNSIASINNVTTFATGTTTNANGVLFSSYLTEEGSFTSARKIYVDDQAPSIAVADFGQKYPVQSTDDATNGSKSVGSAVYSDNIPYSGITSTRSDGATTANWLGHLAYSADGTLTASRPAVSGVVTFKGKAADNQTVKKITATIPGFDGGNGVGVEFEIYTVTNGFEYYNGSSFTSTGSGYTASGAASTLLGTKGWTAWADGTDYKLADVSRVALGHVLNWNFSWDSSKLATVAAMGVVVTFKVYDANTTAQTATTSITVDVGPYITGVTTLLSNLGSSNPSVYNRTALGKYPVNATETVTLNGFNLSGATVNAGSFVTGNVYTITSVGTTSFTAIGASSNTVGVSFTASGAGTGTGTAIGMGISGLTGVSVTGGVVSASMAAATTGNLALKVNNVALINNADLNTNDFNKLPNGVNNNLLNNDVVLDVWQFNNRAAVPISGQVSDPVMKVSPASGKVGLAFTNGPLYFSMAGTYGGTEYSYMYTIASYDFLTSVGFAYDSAGKTYATTAGGDINSSSADKYVLQTDRWGKSDLSNVGTYNGTNTLRLESIGLNVAGTYDFDKYRIKSPNIATSRLATGATSTNLYLAYYDNMQNEIAFRYGNLLDTATTKTAFTPRSLVTAGAFVTGRSYTIATVGTTNFVAIGAASSTVGITFTATGAGTGTGTANLNPAAPTLVTAGSFVVGRTYIIQSVGTTNFTTIGSTASTIGTTFTASGVGTGTGTAYTTAFPNFTDSDTAGTPPVYYNTYKQIVAGSATGRNAGEFVSIAVVPDQTVAATAISAGGTYIIKSAGTTNFTTIGASANTVGTVFTATAAGTGTGTVSSDVVVMVWYDATGQNLWYTYNTTPTVNRSGTATAGGWSAPLKIFSNAGQYCQVVTDAAGGIHIAAYDINNASLLYANLTSYSAGSASTSVVDSYGIVGTNITLDVAYDSTKSKYIPYIGYYALSSIRPKYAYLVDTGSAAPAGASNDYFTGSWEVSLLPTSSSVPQDRINAAVWKTTAGVLTTSTTGTSAYTQTGTGYTATNNGTVYGNGTNNAVLAYAIKESTKGYIETAQRK